MAYRSDTVTASPRLSKASIITSRIAATKDRGSGWAWTRWTRIRRSPSSCMHPCALGDFVDKLPFLAQGQANDVQRFRSALLDGGPVRSVVAGREHFLDV